MENTVEKRKADSLGAEIKKSRNHKSNGFFDGGSGGYEPLHGTKWTVSVTKHVGKKKEINYGELDFNSI